jgi:hypothetical protein
VPKSEVPWGQPEFGGPYYQQPQPPRKKRHLVRNILLGVAGLFVLFIVIRIIGTAVSGSKPTASSSSSPATSAPTTTAPAAATFSSADEKFFNDVTAAFPSLAIDDSTMAKLGTDTCNARKAGTSQAMLYAATNKQKALLGPDGGPKIVRLAEKDLCPQYLPVAPTVLFQLSGSGIENSSPFVVNSGTVTVHYTYNCASAGGTGNFIADLETGDQSSLNSDDQSIANALGADGSVTTTVYPQDVGAEYHLAVNSECTWSIVVESAGS